MKLTKDLIEEILNRYLTNKLSGIILKDLDKELEKVVNDRILDCKLDREHIIKNIESLDYYENDNGDLEAIICTLISGSYGQYTAQKLCELFEIDACKDPENEFYCDEYTKIEEQLSEAINDYIQLDMPGKYSNISFYIGNNDSDNAIELFAIAKRETYRYLYSNDGEQEFTSAFDNEVLENADNYNNNFDITNNTRIIAVEKYDTKTDTYNYIATYKITEKYRLVNKNNQTSIFEAITDGRALKYAVKCNEEIQINEITHVDKYTNNARWVTIHKF